MIIEIGLADGVGSLVIDIEDGGRTVEQVTEAIYTTLEYTPFPIFTDRNKGMVLVARSRILYLQVTGAEAVPVTATATAPTAPAEQKAADLAAVYGPEIPPVAASVTEEIGYHPDMGPVLVGV